MHPKVSQAFEEIDAAIYNGDDLEPIDERVKALEYIWRWFRYLNDAACDISSKHSHVCIKPWGHEGSHEDEGGVFDAPEQDRRHQEDQQYRHKFEDYKAALETS